MIGLIRSPYGRCSKYMIWVSKLLNGIKSMEVNSLTHVRVKGDECFRIDSGVR